MTKRFKFLLILSLVTIFSCSESFLDEKPLDFFSTENAFQTANDFDASVNNLYRLVREEFYTINDNDPMEYLYRTDIAYQITVGTPNLDGDFSANSAIMSRHWTRIYKIVAEANTVLTRIPNSSLNDAQKTLFEAKARFFRAFGYRSLAYLFGGVPLVLAEVAEEKVDFTRASRQEVYAQAIQDLTFAAANLPAITAVKDGEISNAAANHLLAEVYLANGQNQEAVDAASKVLNDPAFKLMTERFGSRKAVTPGDVYWDLFRKNNQNRKSGNTEGIWVIQIEDDVPGGAASTSVGFASGDLWSMERVHVPLMRDVRIDGVQAFNWPASDYSSGGRGVGFLAPSTYFINEIYKNDFDNDIRNANHNFVRKFKITNPAHPKFNQELDFHNIPAGVTGLSGSVVTSGNANRAIYPYQSKATTPFNHPANLYVVPPPYPEALKGGAGGTYVDQYLFRLAETYLLRAEAYIGLGNNAAAAADVNVVRARSNATPATAGEMNLDYILDERMRELGVEEKRMFTLMRMGKLYDRIQKCNPFYAPYIKPHNNLWPIPQGEIERNRGAELTQNPGY